MKLIDNKYVLVEKGDTLWGISVAYYGGGPNWKKLAAINKIPEDPGWVYIGQKVYLNASDIPGSSGGSGGSGGSSTSTSSSARTVTNIHVGELSTEPGTLFVTWDWSKESQTESYKVVFKYYLDKSTWLSETKDISVDKDDYSLSKRTTWNIPSNATKIEVKIKPIAKKETKDNKETSLYTSDWSSVKTWTNATPLSAPSSPPSVELEKYQLTATLDGIDILGATHIEFEVYRDNSTKVYKKSNPAIKIETGHVSYTTSVDSGSEYKVRCRATDNKGNYSEWTDYSSNVGTIPATPDGAPTVKATSKTSVEVKWNAVSTAETYDIQYTTEKKNFDYNDDVNSKTGVESNVFEITGLTGGYEYFFRVRATNGKGSSGWSAISSVVIGTKPAAPTTWSSTTTAVTGEELNLYWVHNTQDGSSQTYAILELYINGVKQEIEVANSTDEEEKDKTSVYSVNTSAYVEGTKLEWRVKTRGITDEYSDWSIQRTVDIYAPPTLELSVVEVITSFPFDIYAKAGPNTQTPIGYQVSIIANEQYVTADNYGNEKTVKAGEAVYSKYFNAPNEFLLEMTADKVDLENNVSYDICCTVTMNSGLTATATRTTRVAWSDIAYIIDAEIGLDPDTLTTSIRPFCAEYSTNNYEVSSISGEYVVGTETLGWMSGSRVAGAYTTTGEPVYQGTTAEGVETLYCTRTATTSIEDVYLSVYRREFDGSFTELAVDLDGARNETILDPHPALDYARYRLIARAKDTGAISYYDPPGYPVGGKAIVIQWDEEWTNYEAVEGGMLAERPWAGSMLKLLYNVDVSDSTKPDVALVNYIGREHPTSYYGTQIGQTATWTTEVPKSDKETLYALRRLSRWMGDVYVREPSGSGYWANITVSFSQAHKEVFIPVTLTLTRVEGGA